MSFKINSLYLTDGYKVGHKAMLAPGTTKLYGTWIPRSTKHAPKGITKIIRGFVQINFQIISTADSKLSYTPCYTTFLNIKL